MVEGRSGDQKLIPEVRHSGRSIPSNARTFLARVNTWTTLFKRSPESIAEADSWISDIINNIHIISIQHKDFFPLQINGWDNLGFV